jgi:hypothetical protein
MTNDRGQHLGRGAAHMATAAAAAAAHGQPKAWTHPGRRRSQRLGSTRARALEQGPWSRPSAEGSTCLQGRAALRRGQQARALKQALQAGALRLQAFLQGPSGEDLPSNSNVVAYVVEAVLRPLNALWARRARWGRGVREGGRARVRGRRGPAGAGSVPSRKRGGGRSNSFCRLGGPSPSGRPGPGAKPAKPFR